MATRLDTMEVPMGFLDKVKVQAGDLLDKAVDTAAKNSDKITEGLDKAGDFVDKRTKGKYTDKIATGKVKAKQGLEKLESKNAAKPAPPPAPRESDAFGTPPPAPAPDDTEPTPPPLS
jgi:hypothetical protein